MHCIHEFVSVSKTVKEMNAERELKLELYDLFPAGFYLKPLTWQVYHEGIRSMCVG